jgi:hypothetical protein
LPRLPCLAKTNKTHVVPPQPRDKWRTNFLHPWILDPGSPCLLAQPRQEAGITEKV